MRTMTAEDATAPVARDTSGGSGGFSGPTIGFLAVGASAFALLASGPRLLGTEGYSQLAVAWSILTIYASGIGVPGEQAVVHAVAAGTRHSVELHVRNRMMLAVLPLVAGLLAALFGLDLFGLDPMWWAFIVLGALSWAMLAVVRGELAGAGDFNDYGAALIVEAISRVAVIGLAWAASGPMVAAVLLAAAMGLPNAGAAAWLYWRRHRLRQGDSLQGRREDLELVEVPAIVPMSAVEAEAPRATQLGSLTAIALAMQVILTTAPLWLAAGSPTDAATAGLYVSASSYMRVPLLATGGALAVILSRASSTAAQGDRRGLTRLAWRSAAGLAGSTAALGALLVAFSGLGLTLIYGEGADIGVLVLVAMAVTVALFSMGYGMTQVSVGCRDGRRVAWIWVGGAAVTTALLALMGSTIDGATLALLIGVTATAVALAIVVPASIRSVPDTASPPRDV